MRLRHESDHAAYQSEWRGITTREKKKALRAPDKIENKQGTRLHYSFRDRVAVVAVIVVGTGTAIITKNPIAGMSAGTCVTIVTWMLKRI